MKNEGIIIAIFFLVVLLLLQCYEVGAQAQPDNLVQNPSFEGHIYCPDGQNQFVENVVNWLKVTATTPDYYNTCANNISSNFGVPDNFNGSMSAKTGDAYAGIVTYSNDHASGTPWKEYLQTSMLLEEGIEYDISFNAVLASNSGWSTKDLGAHFSSTLINSSNTNPIVLTPTFQHPSRIVETSNWTALSFTYTPTFSGTHYLVIGDFSSDNSPQETSNSNLNGYAYYYIDDVSVTAEGCCPEHINIDNITYANGTETTVAAGTITAGNNVVVSSGATVNYIASTTIELPDGFSTEPGAEFSASIAACPPQFQQRTVQQFPNVITPNGDGINDELCILSSGGSHWSIEIYNQWGNLLYAAGGPITEYPICVWDGDCNQPFPHCTGAPISDGTYYGIFKLQGCDMPDEGFTQNIYVAGAQYRLAGEEDDELTKQTVRNVSLSESTLEKTVSETDEETTATIYPNPSAGIITVRLPQHESPSTLQVFDARGELVWRMAPTEQTTLNVDLSAHPVGVYLLRFLNGNNVFTERFVIR